MVDHCPKCNAEVVHVSGDTEQAEYWVCSAHCGFGSDTPDRAAWVIAAAKVVMDEAHREIARIILKAVNQENTNDCPHPCVTLDWLNVVFERGKHVATRPLNPERPVQAVITVPPPDVCLCQKQLQAHIVQTALLAEALKKKE